MASPPIGFPRWAGQPASGVARDMTRPTMSRIIPLQPGLPALLGGAALFAEPCVVNRPVAPERGAFLASIDSILSSRRFTNDGPIVRRFEQQVAERCGVEHVVACANGTLALELLARVHELRGEVIVPAFTFVATAHAFRGNGLTPVFCDVELDSMNMDPASCSAAMSERTSAICAVHLWGRAAPVQALTRIAGEFSARLYFDAAHAFGCSHNGRPIGGFGTAEVFSFHATKILHTMEGGGIATNDEALARELRLVRNFGFSNYDQVDRLGTNAKMHEMSAACGLAVLAGLDDHIELARQAQQRYRDRIEGMDGLRLIDFDPSEQSNFQYVVAEVDENRFGLGRDALTLALRAEGILARRYFHPGVHRMEPYCSESQPRVALPNTEALARRVLLLPGGGAIRGDEVELVVDAIERIHEHRQAVAAHVGAG